MYGVDTGSARHTYRGSTPQSPYYTTYLCTIPDRGEDEEAHVEPVCIEAVEEHEAPRVDLGRQHQHAATNLKRSREAGVPEGEARSSTCL